LKTKRLVFAPDPHCGHEFGLTPPSWWSPSRTTSARVSKAGRFQRQLWGFYTKAIDSLKPIDILGVPGDAIEGKGERSGGVELITSDRHEQVRMAKEAIDYAEAKMVRLTYGTRYHTGRDEDYESILRDTLNGNTVIHGHDFFSVNGVNFDVKHKVGSSAIPHGRHTAISRDRLWNVLWSAEGDRQPKADILIRAHVHYFGYCGGPTWLGITCPALTYNSSFGIRECSGIVDVGLIVIDIDPEGGFTWHPVLANFGRLKVQPESL
jgi:hypothetical protein